jgi:hypothetical protein
VFSRAKRNFFRLLEIYDFRQGLPPRFAGMDKLKLEL